MSWIEKKLTELADDGYFDGLPGSGEPIAGLDKEYSPAWWAARWIERDAARQSSAELRRRLGNDIATALGLPRHEARRRLLAIGAAVDQLNALLDSPQQLPAIDVDELLIRGHAW